MICQTIDTQIGIPTIHVNHKLGLFLQQSLIDTYDLHLVQLVPKLSGNMFYKCTSELTA